MIPHHLTLKNFLSYRDATLDFRGLHVACICGANGAGKSSLLEAIAWVIWGQSRTLTEDDIIHQGATEARVDFTFEYRQQTYRIIRSRYRGQTSALEFQVLTATGFRSLTERGMRATQQLVLQHLKLDYDTFVNSAYLRQGRADEFMLKRPGDRKQILADLLRLNQYDVLEERARERSRELKAELAVLERSIDAIEKQLEQADGLTQEEAQLQTQLSALQQAQETDHSSLRQLQSQQQQRQTSQQRLGLLQQQTQQLEQERDRLQRDLATTQQQQQQLEQRLAEAEAIAQGFAQFQALQAEDEQQTARSQTHQTLQTQRQQVQQQLTEVIHEIDQQKRQVTTQRDALHQQEQDLHHTLSKADEIETALVHLTRAKANLLRLDQLQSKVSPLLQRRQLVQTQLDRAQARFSARLEELRSLMGEVERQQQRQPCLIEAMLEISQRIAYLEQRQTYQQKVREKGLERRNFLERLQERQRDLERQLAELDQKIQWLQQQGQSDHAHPVQGGHPIQGEMMLGGGDAITLTTAIADYPPCPLCDRELDEQHWHLVLERHQRDRQDVLDQIWVLREQLTTSDREIKVLRQEYRALDKELAQFSTMLERRGQLQQQVHAISEGQQRLHLLHQEYAELEQRLQTATYEPDLQDELRQLDRTLTALAYDDKNHALARGEVDRWRWAEIKQAEIKQAQRQLTQIQTQIPALELTLTELEQQLHDIHHHPLHQQRAQLDRQMADLGYSLEQHTALRSQLREAQSWAIQYRELVQAQQLYPQVTQRSQELGALIEARSQTLSQVQQEIEALSHSLVTGADLGEAIARLEQQIGQRRSQLDQALAHLGRVQQQQQQFERLRQQQAEQQQQLQTLRRHYRVHQELVQAFSKNGIQALMIENVLPQLESEANHILGRLSNHQLHVQFVTQRAGKRRSAAKLIDTLDILISDAQGTRPYETYSGGEAFRVNFAIRLALARLLAQRSGTALQLLIVDEGFGTQDELGCDRLIGAINAIAPDFACILTVTHMPHLKEAFQARIEVSKSERGSCLTVLV